MNVIYTKIPIVKMRFLILVLFFTELAFGALLNANFSTNPAAVNGTVTICKTQSIVYTNTSTGTTSGTTYNWQFQGGNVASANTIGPHTVVYANAGTFTTTLTLSGGSSYSITVVVNDAIPSAPSIVLVEGNSWTTATYNGQNYFNYCDNYANLNGGLFSFTTESTQTDPASQHLINWGDGSSDTYTGTNLAATYHFYAAAGFYTLEYTVVLASGCRSTRSYNLYVGAIPTATISAVGIPTLCNPGSVTYNLIAGAQNSPGTIYTFQVNDGSAPVKFNHPPPATITHEFLNSSCGTVSNINNTVYPNSYQASITTSNPCGNSTNAVGPINIQSAPIANFTRTPSNDNICEGTLLAIDDTTKGGYNIGGPPTYTCTQAYRKYWVITGPGGVIATTSSGFLIPNTYISSPDNFGFSNNQPANPAAWLPTTANRLNVVFNTTGTYTITLYTGSNTCGISSISQTICVAPRVTADFGLTASSVCAPTTIQLTNNSSVPGCSNTNAYSWSVSPSNPSNCPTFVPNDWSFTSGNSTSLQPGIAINSPGIYTISLTTSLVTQTAGALCQPNTKTTTLTVKGKPVTSLTAQTICEGSTITLNPTVFNCYATNPVSYNWDFGATPPTSISSTTSPSPIVTFNTPGVYNYTLTISNECGSNSYNSSITVMPSVHLTASGPTATCVNTTISLTGSITGGATTGTWTASVPGGSFAPSETAVSPTYTPPLDYIGTIQFTLTSDAPLAPCTVVSNSFSTVFNSEATVSAGIYEPICQNSTLILNGSIGGAASTGVWSSSNGGVFSDVTSMTSSFTPPLNYSGPITLTLTTNDPLGPCEAVSESVVIDVLPTPTIDAIGDLIVCDNEVVTPILFSGTNANLFTWTNSNTSIGLLENGSGPISFTATNTTNNPISATITVTPVNNSSTTFCNGTPFSFTITVNPNVQVNTIPNQTYCNGETTNAIVFSTITTLGTTTYSWTNDSPSIGLPTSGTGDIGAFLSSNTTTSPMVATIKVTPTLTYNGMSCIGIEETFTITVNPTPEVVQPLDLVTCNVNTVDGIDFSTTATGGVVSYTWTNDNTTIGLAANGIGNISSFVATNTTTSPLVSTITVTPSFTLNGVACNGPSKTFTITVNPSGQVDNVANQTLCNGDSSAPIVFTTNTLLGTTTYNWTNNTPSIGLPSSGTGDIASFLATNSTLSPIMATITVTPIFTYNGVSCTGNPKQFTITVNPNAQVNTKPNVTFCPNTVVTISAFSSNNTGGVTTYEWTNDNPDIGLASSGTGAIPTFTSSTNAQSPLVANIVVTPYFTNNSVTCSGTPESFTITINPIPQVNSVQDQVVCNGIATLPISFSTQNNLGVTTYNWTNDTPSIGLPSSGSGAIAAFVAQNSTQTVVVATINVTPTYTYNGVSCQGNVMPFTITVNPSPIVLFSENNQTICSEDSSTLVQLTSSAPNVFIPWNAVQPAGITGVVTSGTDTIPVQNLVNTTNQPITITYKVKASTNDLSACQGLEQTYTITVLPKPAIPDENLLFCNGQTLNFTATNGVPNNLTIVPPSTSYNWTISNNPNVTGASAGSGTSINQTLFNTSSSEQIIVYTVTPVANGCFGTPFTITITILPKPDVLFSIGNQVICNNTASQPVALSSTISGSYNYSWTAAIPSGIIGAIANGTDTIPIQNLQNTTSVPLTITYTAFATFVNLGYSCVGETETYSITVNPTLNISSVVSNYNSYNISGFGGNNGFINLTVTGGSGNYSYNWSGPNGFNTNTEDISNLIAGDYTVTINDGYCQTIVLNFTLTQPNELLIENNLSLLQNLNCYGDINGIIGVIITQESVAPYDFEISSNGVIVQSIINSTNLSPAFTGLIAGNYTIRVIDANGNVKTITDVIITQPDELIVATTSTPISCYGANDGSIYLNISGGIAPYTIQWSNLGTGSFQGNLAAGTYTITVTDAVNCVKVVQVTIADLPVFRLDPIVSQITCYGIANGSINLGLTGGKAPIVVTWNDGSAAGLVRNNLGEGIYTATVVDGSGCSITRTFNLISPSPLVLNGIVQDDLNCNSSNSGSINLIVSGGIPPYSFNWSNGATTEDLNFITNGNYGVTVTDSRGCVISDQFTVFRPSPLTITLVEQKDINCETREVSTSFEAQISGGVPPYQITWSSGTVTGNNNQFMTTNQGGLITASVRDASNCSNSKSFNNLIPIIGNANFSLNSFGFTTFGEYAMGDPIQFTNLSTGNFIGLSWDFGDGVFSIEENPTHTYLAPGNYQVTLTVTYDGGCISKHTIILNITKGYKLIIPNGFTPNDDTINDNFGPVFEGLKSLQWSIYDTWGNLIYYEEGDNLAGWNGFIKNTAAENGNYYFKLSAITFYGNKIEEKGPFMLLK